MLTLVEEWVKSCEEKLIVWRLSRTSAPTKKLAEKQLDAFCAGPYRMVTRQPNNQALHSAKMPAVREVEHEHEYL